MTFHSRRYTSIDISIFCALIKSASAKYTQFTYSVEWSETLWKQSIHFFEFGMEIWGSSIEGARANITLLFRSGSSSKCSTNADVSAIGCKCSWKKLPPRKKITRIGATHAFDDRLIWCVIYVLRRTFMVLFKQSNWSKCLWQQFATCDCKITQF